MFSTFCWFSMLHGFSLPKRCFLFLLSVCVLWSIVDHEMFWYFYRNKHGMKTCCFCSNAKGFLFARSDCPFDTWPHLESRVRDTAGQFLSYQWCCPCPCGPSSSLRCVSTGPTTPCSRPCQPTWTTSCTLTSSRWASPPSRSPVCACPSALREALMSRPRCVSL